MRNRHERLIPGLIVVAVGLAAGLWLALRSKPEEPTAASREPPVIRFHARRSATGRRLQEGIPAPPGDGRVWSDFGVGTCLVVGALVYWATQGARPKDEMSSGGAPTAPMAPMAPTAPTAQRPSPGAASPADADAAHEESAELTPEVAKQLQQFRAQVQASPQDLTARRQLTVALLNANLLMEAFEQAKELQKVAPNDPDGLFVEGVVRLAMGQWPLTVQLMDGVLAQFPDHVLAALAKGQAEAALGETAQAIAAWKKGLAAAGGKFPPIEELLAEVEAGGGLAAAAPPDRRDNPGRSRAAPPIAFTSSSRRERSARAAGTAAERPSSSPCAATLRDHRQRPSGSRIRPFRST
jgi:hypothetical protein